MTPRRLCRCGHGFNLHAIGNKRAYCWVVEGPQLTRCPCKSFQEAGE